MHFKRMDVLDFILKFSSEILVLILAVIVGLLNIYFFTGSNKHYFSDQSFTAQFLNLHPSLNIKLAEKNNSVITTVIASGLINQAQADDFIGLDTQTPIDPAPADPVVILNDDGMVKPNPDSIQSLIAKQIKIYQTLKGDSLQSIAAKNGISTQTIKWANGLTSDQIKPGWQLIILPTDGVLVKADANTTLPDIAAKYKVPLDTIISYNLLDSPEDIEPGQLVIVPGGVMPAPPAPKPKPKTAPKAGGKPAPNYSPEPGSDYTGTGHLFPWGYCTWYVASRIPIPWGGNAKNWLANAKGFGAVVSKEPNVGTIVVTNDNRRYGHVAIVEQVTNDSILISEMNYKGKGVVDQRWIPLDSKTIKGYIYH